MKFVFVLACSALRITFDANMAIIAVFRITVGTFGPALASCSCIIVEKVLVVWPRICPTAETVRPITFRALCTRVNTLKLWHQLAIRQVIYLISLLAISICVDLEATNGVFILKRVGHGTKLNRDGREEWYDLWWEHINDSDNFSAWIDCTHTTVFAIRTHDAL